MEEIKKGYTRVSEILSQWNSFAHIDPDVLANKQRIGTQVHENIAAYTEGILLEAHEDIQVYLESFLNWLKKYKSCMEYVKTEHRMYCDELKITGSVDAIVEIGEKKVILDYKTSAQPHKKLWAIQASFYHYLAVKNGYEVDPYVWFVRLKKDGKASKEVEIHCTEELWEVAKSALHTYRYFNG